MIRQRDGKKPLLEYEKNNQTRITRMTQIILDREIRAIRA